jgi:hypothetical protein
MPQATQCAVDAGAVAGVRTVGVALPVCMRVMFAMIGDPVRWGALE